MVRFQGGHNAGHTLVIDGTTYKLSLLPSGVVRPGKLPLIGNGVVVDPWALLDEIEHIGGQGIVVTPENLRIAETATLILPLHVRLDRAREGRIGTTGRGIGPAYEDKVARRAIRLCDLGDREGLGDKVDELLLHHNALLRGLEKSEVDAAELVAQLIEVAPKILPFAAPVWEILDGVRKAGKRILFEGAQGAMLDLDHGTYPFVTSSNTVGAEAAVGYVLGITKAYTTRVGSGPFPTELDDEIGRGLGERGREFGTVTGRRRRCGWFDAVLVRQAIKVSGIDGIALTKLDVLDGVERLKVCVGYRSGGEVVGRLPAATSARTGIEPVYEELEGWRESTRGARTWAELPATAIKYIRRIEELIEAPVALLSTSPERDDTILVRDPFAD